MSHRVTLRNNYSYVIVESRLIEAEAGETNFAGFYVAIKSSTNE